MKLIQFFTLFLVFNSYLSANSDRLISTSPAITEFVHFLNGQEKLIAVSNYCQNKESLPTIGSAFTLDYEKIVTLKPDQIFLERTSDVRTLSNLDKLGLNYTLLKFLRLNEIKASALKMAEVLKVNSKEVEELFSKMKPLKKQSLKVLVVIGEDMKSDNIVSVRAVSRKSFYSDILSLVGAKNILEDSVIAYPILDLEKLAQLNPDMIIRIGQEKLDQNIKNAWKRVSSRKISFVLGSEYVIPGPQVLATYNKMKEVIYENK